MDSATPITLTPAHNCALRRPRVDSAAARNDDVRLLVANNQLTREDRMRSTRTQAVSNGMISGHEIRIVTDPSRQRARAECDRHGWQSEWCAQGPGHSYDPEEGWTPPATLVERVAVFGEQHLRAGLRRINAQREWARKAGPVIVVQATRCEHAENYAAAQAQRYLTNVCTRYREMQKAETDGGA